MALYYDIIYRKAISQCDKVRNSNQYCQEAKTSLTCVLETVSEHWKGEAGAAFCSALEDYIQGLDALISALDTLDGQMRQEANAVLTTWPNTEIDGGE